MKPSYSIKITYKDGEVKTEFAFSVAEVTKRVAKLSADPKVRVVDIKMVKQE
jgi:hypothetical protein